ncbi:growth/differentiation factor 9 [Spea bombifrons]|uniref:growth/differentiation factor 9 n=1 Tax=Spea bombifrons TaxID=233779 RepID=UPI00234ACBE0|nr:growth/differentiation factor 9 [Spea bombifrons]
MSQSPGFKLRSSATTKRRRLSPLIHFRNATPPPNVVNTHYAFRFDMLDHGRRMKILQYGCKYGVKAGLEDNADPYDLLPPLLKELSERSRWEEGTPGPQSVAVKYMKRLYKMSATKEGVPKVHKSHEYNTVRLFTPRAECMPRHQTDGKGALHSMDLTFNVGRVSALEQYLQSVLLYSISKRYSSSNITCNSSLEIMDGDATSPICPLASYFFEFQLQKRQRWLEIDVTSFLLPFISNKQKLHLAFNLTCLHSNQHHSIPVESPFKISRSPPSLLLYLNDTSHKAYHREKKREMVEPPAWYESGRGPSNFFEDLGVDLQLRQASRHRRGQDERTGEEEPTAVSFTYNFSEFIKEFAYHQHECELHQFRLRFSQLKWDKWIIAPHHYSPDYCKGECPRVLGHRYGSPVHTMVQNIIYEKLDSSIPRPSCVPSEYRPMSVLTIEPDNSIAYKEYQDMIATKCTCR